MKSYLVDQPPFRGRFVVWCAITAMAVSSFASVAQASDDAEWSIARIWQEEALESIRNDLARPPVHARNLYHVAVSMYDAWAAYDPVAQGVFFQEKVPTSNVEAARRESISYAAYRILAHRFANSPGAAITLPRIEDRLISLGYDPSFTSIRGTHPAAVGNRIAHVLLTTAINDGSNETNNYAGINPITGRPYVPVNQPLVVEEPGTPNLIFPNRWQSIWLEVFIDQQGNIYAGHVPAFVGPHWGHVTPFGLRPEHLTPGKPGVYLDPGPPPMLGKSPEETAMWIHTFTDVLVTAGTLDPSLGIMIDTSPGVFGNNPLGSNTGTGHGPLNPVTGEPYEPNIVNYGDYGRVIAEFWADGPKSSTPPGHWNEIASENVADHPDFHFKIRGKGEPVDRLEWDVKMYFALNAATSDAAIACWGVKGYYDYVRPVAAIRYMADRGQSSDPELPSYHPHGLPLIDGLIELVTHESIQPGQKHACLAEMLVDEFGQPIIDDFGQFIWDATQFIGEVAVMQWPGPPHNPVSLPAVWVHPDCIDLDTPYSGLRWIRAKRWTTYQLDTFITPPFAAYTSGHTTFSRASAVILSQLTGSPYFPGGLAEYVMLQGEYLDFEYGPSQDMKLQWTSFFDASDQSARSRIYGGIHAYVDDFPARYQGQQIGEIVAARVFQHFDGEAYSNCPGDFTSTGFVGMPDLALMFAEWGQCVDGGTCFCDLNGDGEINVSDLLLLLNIWGPCPD